MEVIDPLLEDHLRVEENKSGEGVNQSPGPLEVEPEEYPDDHQNVVVEIQSPTHSTGTVTETRGLLLVPHLSCTTHPLSGPDR